MPTFTWTITSPASSTPSAPASSSVPEPSDILFGLLDLEIDPVTRDYIDTDDGGWAETATSRTAVVCQLSIRYNAWPADPEAGTRLAEWLESGEPVTAEMVVDDTRRAMQHVVVDGLISDLSVEAGTFDPEAGALELELAYTDVLSGYRVELLYSPF